MQALSKNMSSILEQVIAAKNLSKLSTFNPYEILESILTSLSEREQEVIRLRHGLSGKEKTTLEEIGRKHNITRERVRQIENSSLKKITKNFDATYLKEIEDIANAVLAEHGGLMTEDNLIKELLMLPGDNSDNRAAIRFVLSQLLKNRFHFNKESKHTYDFWQTPEASLEFFEATVEAICKIIENHGEPLTLENLMNKIQAAAFFASNDDLNDKTVVNFIYITKKLKSNPYQEWGLAHWPNISPRRMNDKIYLILQKEGKPLHFTEIANSINKMQFDSRQAYPATIHNELILDDKYVLVGRGIYALKEWGYKPGVVSDVITDILKEAGRPMTKKEIIEAVMKARMIKKTTIVLALMNKNRFQRDEKGRYFPKS